MAGNPANSRADNEHCKLFLLICALIEIKMQLPNPLIQEQRKSIERNRDAANPE